MVVVYKEYSLSWTAGIVGRSSHTRSHQSPAVASIEFLIVTRILHLPWGEAPRWDKDRGHLLVEIRTMEKQVGGGWLLVHARQPRCSSTPPRARILQKLRERYESRLFGIAVHAVQLRT